jgi:hypothetical protein
VAHAPGLPTNSYNKWYPDDFTVSSKSTIYNSAHKSNTVDHEDNVRGTRMYSYKAVAMDSTIKYIHGEIHLLLKYFSTDLEKTFSINFMQTSDQIIKKYILFLSKFCEKRKVW